MPPPVAPPERRRVAVRPRIAVGLIAAVAFLVRLLHVLSYDPHPTNDMAVYLDMAVRRLSLANLFSMEGICWFPPGYALFLKPFLLALPLEAALRAVAIAQAAIGAWTVVLVHRLTRRAASRRAALAAALLAAFFPHFVFYSSAFMSETLFTAIWLAALLLFLRAAERPSAGSLYRAGLVAAAAVLVRPAGLSVWPAALLAAWRAAPARAGRLRALAVATAGGLTLMAPWAIRNWIAYDHFVLIAPNSGFNLAIGNHPEATGRYTDPPSMVGNLWARMDHFQQQAIGFVTNDPWGALFVVLRLKWRAFWEFIPPWPLYSSNPRLYAGEMFFPYIAWRNVLFLGLIGLGVLIARRRRDAWVTPACLGAYVAFYMIFFGGSRFRLPAESIFLAWAGVAIAAAAAATPGLRRLRAPQWGAAIGLLLALILAEVGWNGAGNRAFLREDASRIAVGDQFPVLPTKASIPLFGADPIPLDRDRGRFLRLSFTVHRQGPHRDSPNNGLVRLTFLDRTGRSLPWLDNPAYYLEALPPGRWSTVVLKAHIPVQAVACTVALAPDRGSPDTLIVDQPVLRYARGNDLALESVFAYLRYDE